MLRYKTETRPGLVDLYDIRPGNGASQFLQPQSPHGANKIQISTTSIYCKSISPIMLSILFQLLNKTGLKYSGEAWVKLALILCITILWLITMKRNDTHIQTCDTSSNQILYFNAIHCYTVLQYFTLALNCSEKVCWIVVKHEKYF